jgi:hypothetical protein
MLSCFSKYYFGVECPGCGIQRSFVCLIRGDILDSLALYPALIPFMVFCVVGILSLFKNIHISTRWITGIAIFTSAIMLIHYFLKITGNAPWYDHAAACFHL